MTTTVLTVRHSDPSPQSDSEKHSISALNIIQYQYLRSSSVRQGRAPNTDRVLAKPTFQTNTVTHYNKFKKKVDRKYLEVGQNVMCIHNKEMATVRYVGHADFAPGIWIGLELKKALGELSLVSCLV